MNSTELRNKFLEFFKARGHAILPSASLVPENDPTVLFTTAGMQPLVPYLLGQKHPMGQRLANSQKCFRTGDIDEVGDKVHHTFFEMLGNWSLGDYFKTEAIDFSYELLMSKEGFGLDKSLFAVSVFAGDDDSPFDEEAYQKWLSLGIAKERIAKLPKKNNWWGPAGLTGPCGPDTEMFVWTGDPVKCPVSFQETESDPNWVEIWNNVFMQYNKTNTGQFEPLKQKNVDTGMGLERMLAILNKADDNYRTDLFWPIIEKLEALSGKKYDVNQKEFRIIADHLKAATFALGDGVLPSNKEAGYVVRRLIRRAIVKAHQLGIEGDFTTQIAEIVFLIYKNSLLKFTSNTGMIKSELKKEEKKFLRALNQGLREFEKNKDNLTGDIAFNLYQTFGFPLEMTMELANESGIEIEVAEFEKAFQHHQELSRTASAGMFKGGLVDAGEIATKYHTATHLLLAALRQVLGDHVLQKGSNINAERLRFDFSHTEKMTAEQIKEVEEIINEVIGEDLPVTMEEMSLDQAKAEGAMGVFEAKYGDKVKVYTIGESKDKYFSKEICGGPHVERLSQLGYFRIQKEESSSSGVRRIKAVLQS